MDQTRQEEIIIETEIVHQEKTYFSWFLFPANFRII